MAAPPPSAGLGLLHLGGRGVLPPSLQQHSSSSGHGLFVSRRGVGVVPLRWDLVRGGRVLDARAAGVGAAGALASGEAGAGSSELRRIEKELTFSPTFTDYVKIMESVKLDQSKNFQGGDSDGRSSRGRLLGNGDVSVVRRADRRMGDPRNKSFERKRGPHRNRRDEKGKGEKSVKNFGQRNANRLVEKRLPADVEKNRGEREMVERYVQRRIVRGELSETESSAHDQDHKQFASHVKAKDTRDSIAVHQIVRNKLAQPNSQKDSQRRTSIVSRTSTPLDNGILLNNTKSMVKMGKEKFTSETSSLNEHGFKYPRERKNSNSEVNTEYKFRQYQERVERNFIVGRFANNNINCKKPTVSKRYGHMQTMSKHDGHQMNSLKFPKSEGIRTQRGENIQIGRFARTDDKATEFDDRAAFKTFEIFTDIRNRPRVLQMEMEERIQKLASRLNATDINTPEWKFSKIIHDANINFSEHSILRIVQILGRYGNWKRVLQVVEWLQSRERFKSYRSRYIYTTVLDVLGKAKRPFEALNVFNTTLDQLSSYPDIAAYHCIAVILGQAGLVKELFDVIDCMRSPPRKKFKLGTLQDWYPRLEPDLIVYNAVLNACVQQKQWEGAFWVLQQLKEKNIRPTNTTYGLVMEVMLVCGKYNLVYEFFNKVEKLSIPGALNYKVLVNALWSEGKIDEAVMAVKDMESRGVVGSASLYYDLARCLCSGGRCKEALLQVEKICKVAKKPLVVTYTGLIQTCIDNGSMKNAKYIFNEMCSYCSPNNVTCNIMLKSYIKHRMFEDAKDLLEDILNGRIKSKVDSSQKAIADKFTFNTFLEACAEEKKWNDFECAFRKMLSNGYHFDERRHLRMVLDAYRNGKEQMLEDIWDYLCHHDRVPPTPLIMERFCLKLRRGDTMAAISCITSFQEGKIRNVSSMSWFNLLNQNSERLAEENIIKLVHELNRLESVSSRSFSGSLYQNILSSCTEFLSGATVAARSPFDHQMSSCN